MTFLNVLLTVSGNMHDKLRKEFQKLDIVDILGRLRQIEEVSDSFESHLNALEEAILENDNDDEDSEYPYPFLHYVQLLSLCVCVCVFRFLDSLSL